MTIFISYSVLIINFYSKMEVCIVCNFLLYGTSIKILNCCLLFLGGRGRVDGFCGVRTDRIINRQL